MDIRSRKQKAGESKIWFSLRKWKYESVVQCSGNVNQLCSAVEM